MPNDALLPAPATVVPTAGRRPISWRAPAVLLLIAALAGFALSWYLGTQPRRAVTETEVDMMLVLPAAEAPGG